MTPEEDARKISVHWARRALQASFQIIPGLPSLNTDEGREAMRLCGISLAEYAKQYMDGELPDPETDVEKPTLNKSLFKSQSFVDAAWTAAREHRKRIGEIGIDPYVVNSRDFHLVGMVCCLITGELDLRDDR